MADQALAAILSAWDKSTGKGRDEDKARQLAKDYVEANPSQFESLDGKTVDELVSRVDFLRETAESARTRGLEDAAVELDAQKLLVDTFLLACVPKRHIGAQAELNLKVRLPNGR
jgi:hypothetical protein